MGAAKRHTRGGPKKHMSVADGGGAAVKSDAAGWAAELRCQMGAVNCNEETCDWWHEFNSFFTCSVLEEVYECDCTGCTCVDDSEDEDPTDPTTVETLVGSVIFGTVGIWNRLLHGLGFDPANQLALAADPALG